MLMDFAPIWVILKPGATETEIMPKHFGRKPYGRNYGRYYGRKAYGRTLTKASSTMTRGGYYKGSEFLILVSYCKMGSV